jgi:hypothetical protein
VVFSVGPGGGLQNTGLSATITNESVCILQDSPSFNSTTGILSMKFNVATPTTAVWNGWLADQNTLVSLWSESLVKTEPPVTMTKTKSLAKIGRAWDSFDADHANGRYHLFQLGACQFRNTVVSMRAAGMPKHEVPVRKANMPAS